MIGSGKSSWSRPPSRAPPGRPAGCWSGAQALAGAMTVAAALLLWRAGGDVPGGGRARSRLSARGSWPAGWALPLRVDPAAGRSRPAPSPQSRWPSSALPRSAGALPSTIGPWPGIGFVTPQRLVAIALLLGPTSASKAPAVYSSAKIIQDGFTAREGRGGLLALVGLGLYAFGRAPPGSSNALWAHPFFGPVPIATLGPAMVGALFLGRRLEQHHLHGWRGAQSQAQLQPPGRADPGHRPHHRALPGSECQLPGGHASRQHRACRK